MAILVIPVRMYANLLDRAVPSHNSLKIRREIQQLRAKKRSARQIQINLQPQDASDLTGRWFVEKYAPDERAGAVAELEALVGNKAEEMREPPCMVYSISEWKALIEMGTGQSSSIDLDANGHEPVFVQLNAYWPNMEDLVLNMISMARNPQRRVPDLVKDVDEGDNVSDEELAFGAVTEDED